MPRHPTLARPACAERRRTTRSAEGSAGARVESGRGRVEGGKLLRVLLEYARGGEVEKTARGACGRLLALLVRLAEELGVGVAQLWTRGVEEGGAEEA